MRLVLLPITLASNLDSSISARMITTIPSSAKNMMIAKFPDFDATLGVTMIEKLLEEDPDLTKYVTQPQSQLSDCKFDPSKCPNGECLYQTLRSVYGNMIGMRHPDSTTLSTTHVLPWLAYLTVQASKPIGIDYSSGSPKLSEFFNSKILTAEDIQRLPVHDIYNIYTNELNTLRAEGEKNGLRAVHELYHYGFKRWFQDSVTVGCRIRFGSLQSEWRQIALSQAKKSVARLAVVMYLVSSYDPLRITQTHTTIPDNWNTNLSCNIMLAVVTILAWKLVINILSNSFVKTHQP